MLSVFRVTLVKHFCPLVSFYGIQLREGLITLPGLSGVLQHGYWKANAIREMTEVPSVAPWAEAVNARI